MANITAKVEVITPEVAKCYLEHNKDNRLLNKGHVAFLAKMMQEGTWQVNGEAIVFDKNGRLVNGQHRLSACVYANIPFETMVIRGVEEETFFTFDTGKTRSGGDVFKIQGILNSKKVSSCINKYLTMCASPDRSLFNSGGSEDSRSFSTNKASNTDLLEEYNSSPELWQNVNSFAYACYKRCRLLTPANVGGIIMFLHKKCGYELEYVCNFFEQLFYEEITEIKTLALLRQKLINDGMKGGTMRMTSKYKEQLIIKAWDSYKTGKELATLRWQPNVEKERRFE